MRNKKHSAVDSQLPDEAWLWEKYCTVFWLLRDNDVLIIKLTGYRFFYVVADFGACFFVEELLAAADDDDDTEDHQKECDDQLETFNKEDSCAGTVSVEQCDNTFYTSS